MDPYDLFTQKERRSKLNMRSNLFRLNPATSLLIGSPSEIHVYQYPKRLWIEFFRFYTTNSSATAATTVERCAAGWPLLLPILPSLRLDIVISYLITGLAGGDNV
jgi:hypothetical protein